MLRIGRRSLIPNHHSRALIDYTRIYIATPERTLSQVSKGEILISVSCAISQHKTCQIFCSYFYVGMKNPVEFYVAATLRSYEID